MESVENPPLIDTATPVMQQYLRLKSRYQEEVLFFRLGDFYEMFYEDAIRASKILDLALTKRQTVPMCGIPHHASTAYIAKLLKAGLSVALAEQLEDPKKTKGMVKRDVVRVITPGTVIEDELLQSQANNFLVAVACHVTGDKLHWALTAADISTGQQWAGEMNGDYKWNALKAQAALLNPTEVILVGETARQAADVFSGKAVVRFEPVPVSAKTLIDQTVQAIQNYLKRDMSQAAGGLSAPKTLPTEASGVMFLDETAVRHLELVESSDPNRAGPTLIAQIDKCATAMGSRLLRWWLLHPSVSVDLINIRLDQVEGLVEESALRTDLRDLLKTMADLDRISVRARAGTASPRDLLALRQSLDALPRVRSVLAALVRQNPRPFDGLSERLKTPASLMSVLQTQLAEQPSPKVAMGGVIREGFSGELDELRSLRRDGKNWIVQMEAAERERTGIGSLKVGYNDVFGYYLEVSKTNLSKVPSDWIRKQTLANAERYITPALKEQEEKLLHAEERILALETALYADLVKSVSTHTPLMNEISEALAHLDGVMSLAETAVVNGYIRPQLSNDNMLMIQGGRHPVIERQIGRDRFIPNDIQFDGNRRISIITGPNMAGKSTYLRQTALLVILAQMGSFVPAEAAEIGVVDRIFTRIGASDRLAQGQSTFMVEMQEVATLMASATAKSLLVLDEVGRGTSTYDGVSIAWAAIDFLTGRTGGAPRTLFATHYFELTQLAETLPGVVNAHATAKEWPDAEGRKRVVFLYQILPGPADRSYGIHVAEMAGLPPECVKRAREILKQLESGTHKLSKLEPNRSEQLDLFGRHPVVDELSTLNVEVMTPLEALNKLAELKKKVEG